MSLTLTYDQQLAFESIQKFFNDEENPAIVISGIAGTGKTFLTKYIVDYILDNIHLSIVAVAPTHKARRVLHRFLNNDRFIPVPTLTVASILGKMRSHHYIGSHKYTNGSKQKMDNYDCFIIDEISMVCDKDLDEIIDYICEHDKKLILIGDNCQIPAPSQPIVKTGGVCIKPDSSAFDIVNNCQLTTIVRQAADSSVIKMGAYLRDHLLEESNLADVLHGSGVDEKEICIDYENVYSNFLSDWKESTNTRIIAYTNASVRAHNEEVRKLLGYTGSLCNGEILTGYNNVGWPVMRIENGTDYHVTDVRPTTSYRIGRYFNLVGNLVDLVDVYDSDHTSYDLFFINVKHSQNIEFMEELVRRAEKVNGRYSTKDDYRKYCALKNRAVFLEDVYKYQNTVMTETDMKQTNPLLFTKVSDVIDVKTGQVVDSELTSRLEDQYGDMIENRVIDNKPYADAEVFAHQYTVVEKDIYYGYSITSHKAQGSTYDNVYVDENDFKKISNRWNYRYSAVEQRHKERNQLRYVAYTRAAKKLKIFT